MKINAESFIYKLALHSCSSDDIITFGNLINWAFLSSLSIIIGYLFSYLKLFSLALLAFVIYSYNMDWIGSGPIGPAIILNFIIALVHLLYRLEEDEPYCFIMLKDYRKEVREEVFNVKSRFNFSTIFERELEVVHEED